MEKTLWVILDAVRWSSESWSGQLQRDQDDQEADDAAAARARGRPAVVAQG